MADTKITQSIEHTQIKCLFDQERILSLIGNYQLHNQQQQEETPHQSHMRIMTLLGTPGLNKLYRGCKKTDVKIARIAFIKKLATILQTYPPFADNGEKRINLIKLLGKDGIKLYKQAIEEEKNSESFRDAVFLESVKSYATKTTWKKRMILWIAGPSSSGKSFATDAVIREMSHLVDNNVVPNTTAIEQKTQMNNVVIIDGGITREVSQIRQLVLQFALLLGYTGIEDLEAQSKKIKLKNEIRDAALSTDNANRLNLAIPCTFTNPNYFLDLIRYSFKRKILHVFSIIKGENKKEQEFQKTVKLLGDLRAWMPYQKIEECQKQPIKINNRSIGCESKRYEEENFQSGVRGSKFSAWLYNLLNSRPKIHYEITNDLVYMRPIKEGEWIVCNTSEEAISGNVIKTTRRLFERWKQSSYAKTIDLPEWLEPIYVKKQYGQWNICSKIEAQYNVNIIKTTRGEFLEWKQLKNAGLTTIDLPVWIKEQNLLGPWITCISNGKIMFKSSQPKQFSRSINVAKAYLSSKTKASIKECSSSQWNEFISKTNIIYPGRVIVKPNLLRIIDTSRKTDITVKRHIRGNIHFKSNKNTSISADIDVLHTLIQNVSNIIGQRYITIKGGKTDKIMALYEKFNKEIPPYTIVINKKILERMTIEGHLNTEVAEFVDKYNKCSHSPYFVTRSLSTDFKTRNKTKIDCTKNKSENSPYISPSKKHEQKTIDKS